ncbi:hypothetical protein AB0H92_27415 [Streptomyces phaeochromogenes]|uniref:hypothetical protein n=1 Tax=Streptomyces phaeochromogenes TaxID=1923 RepID=UPI0033E4B867
MTESEADLLALIRELDDPEWLEWPQHYDRGATAARFGGLLTRLEGDFAVEVCGGLADLDVQNHAAVRLPFLGVHQV